MSVDPQFRRSSDELTSRHQRTERLRTWLLLGGGFAAVAALGVFLWRQGEIAPSRDSSPGWSPDGRRIVFTTKIDDGVDLFVMNANGTDRRRLTETAEIEGAPAFSPDGTRIAFDTNRDGNVEIYTMGVEGGDLRRLTYSDGRDMSPAWSADGRRIAFLSDRDRAPAFDLYVMNADGGGLTRLTTSGTNAAPRFAPDSRRLAFQVDDHIALLDPASRRSSRLTSGPDMFSSPSWSPDGQEIAYARRRNDQSELFRMRADGTNARLLVSMAAGHVVSPAWSPDGGKIAYVYVPSSQPAGSDRDQFSAIYVIELGADRLTRLSQ